MNKLLEKMPKTKALIEAKRAEQKPTVEERLEALENAMAHYEETKGE